MLTDKIFMTWKEEDDNKEPTLKMTRTLFEYYSTVLSEIDRLLGAILSIFLCICVSHTHTQSIYGMMDYFHASRNINKKIHQKTVQIVIFDTFSRPNCTIGCTIFSSVVAVVVVIVCGVLNKKFFFLSLQKWIVNILRFQCCCQTHLLHKMKRDILSRYIDITVY